MMAEYRSKKCDNQRDRGKGHGVIALDNHFNFSCRRVTCVGTPTAIDGRELCFSMRHAARRTAAISVILFQDEAMLDAGLKDPIHLPRLRAFDAACIRNRYATRRYRFESIEKRS